MPGLVLLLLLLVLSPSCHGFVIAPAWVNPARNPCSLSSWQLLYWPKDKQCYKIFTQGPCPDTQELAYHPLKQAPVCRCPQDLPLHWQPTDKCYSRYTRGPCQVNQFLDLEEVTGKPVCRQSRRCEPGQRFWPPDQTCHQLYAQGPCHKGDLLIVNPLTTEPYCGCDPVLLKQYYHAPLKLCYEQLSRGPCEAGLLFMYNHTTDTTECSCRNNLPNYSLQLNQCFELDNKGPCRKGQVFVYNAELKESQCECKEGYVYWEKSKSCYREYTPGPCKGSQFLIKGRAGTGVCAKNPCSKSDLFFPDKEDPSEGECHKVGNKGPCPEGELVVFESYSGKSYRGNCGCSPGYNQNYWVADGKCYEWYSQGPCNQSFLFKYNSEERTTECVCDVSAGLVYWAETAACYQLYSQGPCPAHAWLVAGLEGDEVYCECKDGFSFNQETYTCNANVSPPGHRFQGLWYNVAEYVERRRKAEGSKKDKEMTERRSSGRIREYRRRKKT